MRGRRLVGILAVVLTAQLTLAACDLMSAAPPGFRRLIIRVDNTSGAPATLFVADDGPGPVGLQVGTAVPNPVPPGVDQDVLFTVPSGGRWIIFVNPRPDRGGLIVANDVPSDVSGRIGITISVGSNGELGWGYDTGR